MASENLKVIIEASNQTKGAFRSASRDLETFADKAERAQGALTGMAIGGTVAFAGLATGLGYFVKQAGDFEQTRITFEAMLGSAQKASRFLANLEDFAAKTPFEFNQLLESSKKLTAFGFSAKELIPTMRTLGNITAGVGQDKLPQLTRALGQVRVTSKLTGEDLNQFLDAGIPIVQELAEITGESAGDIVSATQKMNISYEEVMQALENMSGKGGRFYNLMIKQSTTLTGLISNLTDKLSFMARDIGQVLLPYVKQFAHWLLPIIANIRAWIKANPKLTAGILVAVTALAGLVAVLGGLGLAVLAVSTGLGALGAVLSPLLIVVGAIGAAAYVLYKNWGKVKDGAMAIYKSFKEFFQPILDVIWVQLKKLWAQIKTQLLPALKEWWNLVSPILLPALKILAGVLGGLLLGAITSVVLILRGLVAVFTKVFQWSVAVGKYFQGKMVHAIEIATDGWNGLVDIFETVVDWLSDIIRKADKAVDTLAEVASFGFADTSSYNGEDVDDAVISPTGRVVTTHPKDWLIATKNPGTLMAGGGGVTVNVYGDVSGEELVSKVEQGIMGRLGNNVRMSF